MDGPNSSTKKPDVLHKAAMSRWRAELSDGYHGLIREVNQRFAHQAEAKVPLSAL
jgi:hypothetical protein